MILLISNKWDISLDFVVKVLRQRQASFIRLNTEDLPNIPVHVSFPNFDFRLPANTTSPNLSTDLKSILFRRPGRPFTDAEEVHSAVAQYASEQWHALIDGLQAIKQVLWINHPRLGDRMESKIVQLQEAVNTGFTVPRTCITSSKEVAENFFAACKGRVVAKSLASTLIEDGSHDYFVFTTVISGFSDVDEEELRSAPLILQEYVEHKRDYRITVVGDRVYSVKVVGSNGAPIEGDWRMLKHEIDFIPCKLPSEIEEMCVNLVARNGLTFGAIDLVEASGDFYFLEINPSGEWGWLQSRANLPVAEALADYLIAGTNVLLR